MEAKNPAPPHEPKDHRPSQKTLAPNMLLINADATCSTFATLTAPHSLITGSNWFNSLLHNSNLESCTFQNCEIDGALFDSCSMRGVELRNCDIEGLIINGVRVGSLLKLLMVSEGAGHGKR
jgi:uncharacterized protein YjbI with pentapeptide repeats